MAKEIGELGMQHDNVTIGEVYRICQRIESRVVEQNGRVRKLEEDAARIKGGWAAGWAAATVLCAVGLEWLKHKLGW